MAPSLSSEHPGRNLGEGAASATAMVPFPAGAILFSYFGLQPELAAGRWETK